MSLATTATGSELEKRGLHAANLALALIGGLSLVLAVIAPFGMGMGMSAATSFVDAVVAATVCGGLPLACIASVAASRWLFAMGRTTVALAIAGVPLLLAAAVLTWALAS